MLHTDHSNLGHNDLLPEAETSLISIESLRLQELLHWCAHMNDTRLDWLWMKFFITAIASKSSEQELSNALLVLICMQPAADVLSWSIFGGRLVLRMMHVLNQLQSSQNVPFGMHAFLKQCSPYQYELLNDFMWGTSNFISAQILQGSWLSDFCMEILLFIDVALLALRLAQERTFNNHALAPIILTNPAEVRTSTPVSGDEERWTLWIKLVYSASLACGFCMLRGFPEPGKTIEPWIGSSVCMIAMALFNGIEWLRVINRFQPQSFYAFSILLGGAVLSMMMDCIFPLCVTMAPFDADNMFVAIGLGLGIKTFINGSLKRETTPLCGGLSIFKPIDSRPSLLTSNTPIPSMV